MMENISNHTLQINAWIGLCKKGTKFPDTLRDLNYNPEIIEPSFFAEGAKVNPDIILTTKKHNHSIVIDCKSKTVDTDQLEKYRRVKNNPEILIERGIVETTDRSQFFSDITLSSFSHLEDPQIDDDFSLVKFETEKNKLKRISTYEGYGFDFSKLNNVFPIECEENYKIPTDFYPFDTHEEDEVQFQVSFLQSLMYVALNQKTFDEESILEDAHPLWRLIDNSKKKEFRRKAGTLMGEFRKRGLNKFVERVRGSRKKEWKLSSKTFRSFQARCQELIGSITKSQARIVDYLEEDEKEQS